jgi:hypothetical protein
MRSCASEIALRLSGTTWRINLRDPAARYAGALTGIDTP